MPPSNPCSCGRITPKRSVRIPSVSDAVPGFRLGTRIVPDPIRQLAESIHLPFGVVRGGGITKNRTVLRLKTCGADFWRGVAIDDQALRRHGCQSRSRPWPTCSPNGRVLSRTQPPASDKVQPHSRPERFPPPRRLTPQRAGLGPRRHFALFPAHFVQKFPRFQPFFQGPLHHHPLDHGDFHNRDERWFQIRHRPSRRLDPNRVFAVA